MTSYCTWRQEDGKGGAIAISPFHLRWAGGVYRPLEQPELLKVGARYAVAEIVGQKIRIVRVS